MQKCARIRSHVRLNQSYALKMIARLLHMNITIIKGWSDQYQIGMMCDSQGIYHALSSDEEQIRTLILHAGKVHEPIRCSLRTISLVEEPLYDTLSYVWGDANVTKPIEVEGVRFDATANLERALRHLRDASIDLILWVDAGVHVFANYTINGS